MQRYLMNRIIQSILVLVFVMCLVFLLLRVIGDPVQMWFSGRTQQIDPETIAQFRKSMGFDDPLPIQFLRFLQKAVVGDFGNSFRYKLPATMMVLERIPATLKLTSISLLVALLVSIPLGVFAGVKPGSAVDAIARNPRLDGPIKKLKGELKHLYRFRIGDLRILYEIDDSEDTVWVKTIEWRGSAYK